jgi:hypothetical protein
VRRRVGGAGGFEIIYFSVILDSNSQVRFHKKMPFIIKCNKCGKETGAVNIVDLIKNHRDSNGWFLCQCGEHGYIEKHFDLQEEGETWEPFLRGIITLGIEDDTYQPFVYLVSYKPDEPVNDIWFAYYKDTKSSGGKLKLGYGPGGPPVLHKRQVLQMLRQMKSIGCLSQEEIDEAMK